MAHLVTAVGPSMARILRRLWLRAVEDRRGERRRRQEVVVSGVGGPFTRDSAGITQARSLTYMVHSAWLPEQLDVSSWLVAVRSAPCTPSSSGTEPGHNGKAYALIGPEALTTARQTGIVTDAVGLEARYEEIGVEQAAETLRGAGHLPDMLVPSVLEVLGPDTAALSVSPAVDELTGHPARTFRQWVHDSSTAADPLHYWAVTGLRPPQANRGGRNPVAYLAISTRVARAPRLYVVPLPPMRASEPGCAT